MQYKKAFLFNGIGSRMEKLVLNLPSQLAERFYSYHTEELEKIGLNPDIEKNAPLDQVVVRWVTSSVCDRVIFEYYSEHGIHPDISAGYSSGLINLCACFSVIPFDFSYKIYKVTKQTIMELQQNGIDLDMGTIIGLDSETVQEIINGEGKQSEVVIGSVNSSICVMISGHREAVECVLEKAIQEGAIKAIQMKLPVAFHNQYIEPYCASFQKFCSEVPYADPPVPVVSVIDQRLMTTGADLLYENQVNVIKQMRWDMTIKKMQDLGVTEFYDLSADCAVRKFSKWDKKKSKFYTFLDI